jgi:hypothetical protein
LVGIINLVQEGETSFGFDADFKSKVLIPGTTLLANKSLLSMAVSMSLLISKSLSRLSHDLGLRGVVCP